jgi:flagellar export protein FliJ
MGAFRFRAQAALDLRRTQDEEAQRALAAAKNATAAARAVVERAEHALVEARERAREEEAHAADTTAAIWYRNWMKGLQRAIGLARAALEERLVAERAASARAVEARRRLRSLERLRDRMLRAAQRAELRAEQKAFDLLGSLGHVARRDVPEGV